MSNNPKSRRRAALKCIAHFRQRNDLPETPLRIERREGGIVALIGRAPDGREYGMSYLARA